jgi:hypothetical protein
MQSQLGAPAQIHNRLGQLCLALLEGTTYVGRMACVVGSFAENVSEETVACFGDASAMMARTAGELRRDDSGVSHEMRGGAETAQIAGLCDDGDCAEEPDASEPLESCNQ